MNYKNYTLSFLLLLLCFAMADVSNAQLRINEVGYSGVDVQGAARWVEIYNSGDTDVDVSDYWLCNFPAYSQLNSLTVLEGSLTIPAGGYLVVAFNDLGDGDGEVGLYNSNSFGSADAMVDYMQYGSAAHQREPVAVEAGVWETGAFVPAAAAGQSLSFFDNGGALADNWASVDATPGAANVDNTATPNEKEATLPDSFDLLGHYPEPFNPSTTVLFSLREAASVRVVVYNMLGREVMATPEQGFGPGQNHSILLEASSLPSGTYLYRVLAQGANQASMEVGKMTLLK